jgi:hypothetical protein
MSYFLAKKLKGIANKMGFRTRLAPPSDALPAISDAMANTAVARDVLVSRTDNRKEYRAYGPNPLIVTPSAESEQSVKKDYLRVANVGLKLKDKGKQIQEALIYHLGKRGIYSIIEDNYPGLAMDLNEETIYSGLAKNCLFNWEKCEMEESSPIDYTKDCCVSFPLLAVIALLKGKATSLRELRTGINAVEGIKAVAKMGVNPEIANELLKGPMEEVARTAALRYHTMLFANKFGKKCVPGMCITRSEMLAEWLADIKKRVLQNKQKLEEKAKVMELRRRVASLEALLMAE